MKLLFILGLASLVVTGGSTLPSAQEVCQLMPSIVQAMLAKGPTTPNKDMNSFISVLTEMQKTSQKSTAGRLTQAQYSDYGGRAFASLGAATSTSSSGMSKITSLLAAKVRKAKAAGFLDGASIISLLKEAYPHLGDGSAKSKDAVTKQFIGFLPTNITPAVKVPIMKLASIPSLAPVNPVPVAVKDPAKPVSVAALVKSDPAHATIPGETVQAQKSQNFKALALERSAVSTGLTGPTGLTGLTGFPGFEGFTEFTWPTGPNWSTGSAESSESAESAESAESDESAESAESDESAEYSTW